MSEGFQRVESCKLQPLDITRDLNTSKRVGIPPLSPSLSPISDHRRSNSDIPFGFSDILQSSPPLIPSRRFIKPEDKTFSEYINDAQPQVMDHLFSSSYVSVNNEATSSVTGRRNVMQSCDKREGIKRSANGDIAPTGMHYRSVSMDSAMAKINFADESLKLPGGQMGRLLSSCSMDSTSDVFSLEFGNGVFNDVELKKIMANENLAEMALADPKRVKRILANRQSAARSKERKMRYITELENKVQTLQTETTTLSAQLTLLKRDSGSLTNENNELKLRLQSMEQQAQLRNALNDTLTGEVQRLKMMSMELISGDADNFSQLSISPQMFHHQSKQKNV